MNTRMLLGSLGVAIVATCVTNAEAATCKLRSSSGTCLFWSGSVEADIVTDTAGSLSKDPRIDFTVNPIPFTPGVGICGNPGSKTFPSSGIQVVQIPDFASAIDDEFFIQNVPIQKTNISQGVASLTAFASVGTPKTNVCPNPGWTLLDAVPCSAKMTVLNKQNGVPIDSAVFTRCDLTACATLPINFSTTPPSFQRVQYDVCSAPAITTFK